MEYRATIQWNDNLNYEDVIVTTNKETDDDDYIFFYFQDEDEIISYKKKGMDEFRIVDYVPRNIMGNNYNDSLELSDLEERLIHLYEVDRGNCLMTNKDWIRELSLAMIDPDYKTKLIFKHQEYIRFLDS